MTKVKNSKHISPKTVKLAQKKVKIANPHKANRSVEELKIHWQLTGKKLKGKLTRWLYNI